MDTSDQALRERTQRRRSGAEPSKNDERSWKRRFPGASVSRVARRYDVNANQVFHWRKLLSRRATGQPHNHAAPAGYGEGERPAATVLMHVASAIGDDGNQTPERDASGRGNRRRSGAACSDRVFGRMIGLPAGTRIWIAAGVTDLRRGFTGLSGMVQTALKENPFSGHVFVFRGRRGDLIKMLWWDGDGLCLFAKRLERGRFIWPQVTSGTVALTPAQLSMLLEGIDWRRPVRSYDPQMAV